MAQQDTVPCNVCETDTAFTGTELCTNCWEVKARLDVFARTPRGRDHLLKILIEHSSGEQRVQLQRAAT